MADRPNGTNESLEVTQFRAYPDLDMGMEIIIRCQEVKRWHMVDVVPPQTVAAHSAAVALLAAYIAYTCPGMYFGSSVEVAFQGLIHDLAESMTGDIPSHTKQAIGPNIKSLEDKLTPNWLRPTQDSKVKCLIKLCDLAEAVRYVKTHGVTRVADWAAEGLRARVNAQLNDMEEEFPDVVCLHVRKQLTDYMDVR